MTCQYQKPKDQKLACSILEKHGIHYVSIKSCEKCMKQQETHGLPSPSRMTPVMKDLVQISYPSMIEQAGNFVSSVASFAQNGFQLVPDEVYQARLKVCQGCDWFDQEQHRCRKCGCGSAKLRMADQSCPINLWGPSPS